MLLKSLRIPTYTARLLTVNPLGMTCHSIPLQSSASLLLPWHARLCGRRRTCGFVGRAFCGYGYAAAENHRMPLGRCTEAKSRCTTRRCPGTRDGEEACSRSGRIRSAPPAPTAHTTSAVLRIVAMSSSGMRPHKCERGSTRNAPFSSPQCRDEVAPKPCAPVSQPAAAHEERLSETLGLDSLLNCNGDVLMPRNLPVRIWNLVKQDTAHGKEPFSENRLDQRPKPVGYGSAYQVPFPVPRLARWRFSTSCARCSLSVLRLAPVSRMISPMVARPCCRT